MNLNVNQFIDAHKANVESLFDLSVKTFAGFEKFVELNVSAARAHLNEVAEHAQTVMNVKDAQEFVSIHSSLVQPYAEKAVSFGRHVSEISSELSGEFTNFFESKTAAFQQGVFNFVDTAAKNAPAGSEGAVAFVKTAVNAANKSYETVQNAVKQGVDVAKSTITVATDSALNTAKVVAPAAKTVARKRAA